VKHINLLTSPLPTSPPLSLYSLSSLLFLYEREREREREGGREGGREYSVERGRGDGKRRWEEEIGRGDGT